MVSLWGVFLRPVGGVSGSKFELLDGEELVHVLRPHMFAFYDLYLVWLWVVFLSLFFVYYGVFLVDLFFNPLSVVGHYFGGFSFLFGGGFLGSLPGVSSASDTVASASSYSPVLLWVFALVLTAVVVSVLKIDFKWVLTLAGVGLLSVSSAYYLGFVPETSYYLGVIYSFFGMFLVELYRRAHTFYVSNYRIVTEVDFLKRRRNELSYEKINNVVLEQGVVASLFNFGTIIPVTASGLGMGADYSSASVGGAGQVKGKMFLGAQVTGGRSIQTPRVRSMYCLFGVSNPDVVHKTITKNLHEYVNVPYLKRMSEQLESLNKKLK
jgi:hypothetical protein